jgi:hypothetical protein
MFAIVFFGLPLKFWVVLDGTRVLRPWRFFLVVGMKNSTYCWLPAGVSIPINQLQRLFCAGEQLRFDWFVLFLELTVLVIVTLALAARQLEETRVMVVGFLAGNRDRLSLA